VREHVAWALNRHENQAVAANAREYE